jgi:exonuclease SbcD
MGCIIDIEPPPGALVRFISDLHLGHERCEAPPMEQLAELLQGVDILVVAGDLAETRPCAWQERGLAARNEFRSLCQANGVQLMEISGNHDPDTPALMARFWGGRVVAMHGHALHKEVAPWSW